MRVVAAWCKQNYPLQQRQCASQSLAKEKKLGEKTGRTNLHENAIKSSFTAPWRSYCKVLLFANVPLVWEAEPGGVARKQ